VHVRLVNANTTPAMTRAVEAAARAVAGPLTTVDAVTPRTGPASVESHYEEALAVPGLLERVAEGEREGVDGWVVACFGDPGVDAARELAAGPVLGIAEAAFHAATMVSRRFGVVTTLGRTTGRAWDLVRRHGHGEACTEVRACDVPVLELDDPASEARRRVTAECRAVLAGGADAVVLGCAGLADLCHDLTTELGAPVVDGVAAATTFVESLVALRLTTSTRGEYAPPPAKRMTGLLAPFERVSPP